MEFSLGQIDGWLASVLWPFFRIAGLLTAMAIFGTRSVPARVRLVLAIFITVVAAPVLPAMPQVPLFSGASFIITGQEVIIGLMMGFITRLLLEIFVVAGQLVSLQTGLGFGSLVDPMNGASVPLISQAFLIIATLLFLAFDGHLLFIELVVESFHTVPVATDSLARIDFLAVVDWGRWLFAGGLMVALAAVLALLMLNLAFGVLTRAAPQLNLFVIGFPATMVVGFILLWLLTGDLLRHFEREFGQARELACALINTSC
ncbi:flagellar type III secretion system protein FliR [Permianibacter sp. IMCC34836]|uniref:flagellar biosynthetic protein FliR n=1 Tax=Permianibacter fluminis TaxID=2738515 RepID=UPI00155695C3|nr:flagellar biosynthetic protein FliR [Permianibacter fluminis]NQD38024.1 flagellar type III secretion system protein FliR [Permianibacter fluminis]